MNRTGPIRWALAAVIAGGVGLLPATAQAGTITGRTFELDPADTPAPFPMPGPRPKPGSPPDDDDTPRGHVDIPEIDRDPPEDEQFANESSGGPGSSGPSGDLGSWLFDFGDDPIKGAPVAPPTMAPPADFDLLQQRFGPPSPTGVSGSSVPAPGAVGLLGLAGIAALRRRR